MLFFPAPHVKFRRGSMNAVSFAALVLGTLTTAPAHADASEAATSDDGVEAIVVTARRRDEDLQDSPVSISAFSADALEVRQVRSIADVGRFAPNVSLDAGANLAGSSATVTSFIRGIGQTDFNLTIDPGVGMYVDGVYVSRSVGALLDVLDVDSIQILRGPQGTLFGKNTVGGAVVVTSRKPAKEFEGSIEVTTGSFDRFDTRAMLNVPVTDRLQVRLSGSLQTRDGYVERLVDGDHMGNQNSLSGRLVAAYQAADNLDFTLAIDGNRRREQGKPVVLLGVSEGVLPQGFPNAGGFFSFFHNKVTAAPQCGAPGELSPINNPNCFNAQWITGDPDKSWASGDNVSDLDLWGASLTAEWRLPVMTIKSITAYRDLNSSFFLDMDTTPLLIGHTRNDYTQRQFSQEFQFSGDGVGGKLDWVAGLYYLSEEGTDRNNLQFAVADFLSGGKVDNNSYAAFAQITYALTDRLSLTAGGRFTHEVKRFLPDQFIVTDRTGGQLLALSRCFISPTPTFPPNPACVADPVLNPNGNRILPFVELSTKANEFTSAFTADYRLTDDVLAYASYAQGFKSGGFTQRVFPPEPVTPTFEPEHVDSYEIGLKTKLFGNRVRLNGAAFRTDYSNLQIIVNEGVAPKVRNAAKARIKGFELEAEVVPAEGLQLSAAVGYTDARYLEVAASAAPVTVDSKLPNAPKWTATAGATVEVFRNESGGLSMRADWSHRSGHYKDAVNSTLLFQEAASVVNISATYQMVDRGWSLTAGITNLTDERYLQSGHQDLANVSTVNGSYSRPREWFVRGRYVF